MSLTDGTKMTGEKRKSHSNLFSNTLKRDQWFQVPLKDTANGLGLQKAGDEKLQKPDSFTAILEKWKRNVSKIIHITYTIAGSLLIALGGLKQQPVKISVHQSPCEFQTRSKKRLCLYIILTCQVLFGDLKRHCKALNKSYYILL